MKPSNAEIERIIRDATKDIGVTFLETTHYRSPDGYVSFAARIQNGKTLSIVATPKRGSVENGITYALVLQNWSDSSSGRKTVGSKEVEPSEIAANIKLFLL